MTDNNYGDYERHFEVEPAPELSRLSELPEWKEPDYSDHWGYWEEDLPFASTSFDTTHVKREDWW